MVEELRVGEVWGFATTRHLGCAPTPPDLFSTSLVDESSNPLLTLRNERCRAERALSPSVYKLPQIVGAMGGRRNERQEAKAGAAESKAKAEQAKKAKEEEDALCRCKARRGRRKTGLEACKEQKWHTWMEACIRQQQHIATCTVHASLWEPILQACVPQRP